MRSEKTTGNNASYRKVEIGGADGARTVKVAKVGIIDEPTYEDEGPVPGPSPPPSPAR